MGNKCRINGAGLPDWAFRYNDAFVFIFRMSWDLFLGCLLIVRRLLNTLWLVLPSSFAVLLAAGCEQRVESQCGLVSSQPNTPEESKALNHAKAQVSASCSDKKSECQYLIRHSQDGDILVRINFVHYQPQQKSCIQAGDGVQDNYYDQAGTYLRQEVGG